MRLVQGGLKALGESGHKGYLDRRRGSGPPRIGRTWVHVQNPLVRSVFYSGRTGTMTEVGVDGSVSESYSVHKYQFYDRVRELDEVAFQQICFGGLSKPSK